MTLKKPSPFSKKMEPRQIRISDEPVTLDYLPGADKFPAVLRPALPKLDPFSWAEGARALIESTLMRHGAVLFRGFELPTRHQFEAFARAILPELYSEYGDLPKAGKIYEVTPYPPEKIIGFHNESSHMHRWPMRQFFYCETPAQAGGETPIVDCRGIYGALPEEVRTALAEKGLRYIRNFLKGVDVPWSDFFNTQDRDEVANYCNQHGIGFAWDGDDLRTWQDCPGIVAHPVTAEKLLFAQIQLHHIAFLDEAVRTSLITQYGMARLPRQVTFGDGSEIPFAWAEAIDALYWERSAAFLWEPGDVLMVDNMLVAHARQTYTPPRSMFVAMGQILEKQHLPAATGVNA